MPENESVGEILGCSKSLSILSLLIVQPTPPLSIYTCDRNFQLSLSYLNNPSTYFDASYLCFIGHPLYNISMIRQLLAKTSGHILGPEKFENLSVPYFDNINNLKTEELYC